MPNTLLLSPRLSEDSLYLNNAAIDIGWDVERCHAWKDVDNYVKTTKNVHLYSEWMFGEYFTQRTGIKYYTPDDGILLRMSTSQTKRTFNIVRGLNGLKEILKSYESVFAKPLNSKTFTGRIFNNGDEEYFKELNGNEDIDLIVSNVIDIDSEIRFFVGKEKHETKEKIQTGHPLTFKSGYLTSRSRDFVASRYPYKLSKPFESDGIYALIKWSNKFVHSLVRNDLLYDIDYSFSIDVGYNIEKDEFFVIELNPIWQSGLYGVSPMRFLKLLEECKINDK